MPDLLFSWLPARHYQQSNRGEAQSAASKHAQRARTVRCNPGRGPVQTAWSAAHTVGSVAVAVLRFPSVLPLPICAADTRACLSFSAHTLLLSVSLCLCSIHLLWSSEYSYFPCSGKASSLRVLFSVAVVLNPGFFPERGPSAPSPSAGRALLLG